MQLTPGSAPAEPMLLNVSFTGSVDLEPGRINHDVSGSFTSGKGYGERALSPVHGTVVGRR